MLKITQLSKITALFIGLLFGANAFAQIGIGTTTPAAGSVLDITSTDKGILVPRVDIANLNTIAPVTGGATDGLLVWNTRAGTGIGYHYWSGIAWVPLSTGTNWSLFGNAATAIGTNFLGTTDNLPFALRTNNIERIRVLNTGNVGIGLNNPTAQLTVNQGAIFNESGGDFDFRIESDTRPNMFFVDASTDRIGINTNAPAYQFQMRNTGNIGATSMGESTNTGIDGVAFSAYNSGTTNGYNGFEGVTNYSGTNFTPSGVFGLAINASLTHVAIGVRGTANGRDGVGVYGSRQRAAGLLGWGGVFYNDLGYTGFFGAASDERTKTNIEVITNALNIINQLNPVTYNFDLIKYPNMGLNTEKEYGFIAQEVRQILPEIVRDKYLDTNATSEVKDKSKIKNNNEQFVVMDYTRIIPILTKGIKEQQSIIDNQNLKIESLELKLLNLESKVNIILKTEK